VVLEQKLKKTFDLGLHIMELVIAKVFDALIEPSSWPWYLAI